MGEFSQQGEGDEIGGLIQVHPKFIKSLLYHNVLQTVPPKIKGMLLTFVHAMLLKQLTSTDQISGRRCDRN